MYVENTTLVLLGFLPFVWDTAAVFCAEWGLLSYTSNPIQEEIVITTIFVCILGLHEIIVRLPFSIYKTFVIEEKHGFNKTTLVLFLRDKVVSAIVGFITGVPVISLLIWVVRIGGPYFYFYVWVLLFIVSTIFMTLYPTLIAPLFNKYTNLDNGPVYDAISGLAKQVSFPLTKIFVVDGSTRSAHSNAYLYGFFKVIILLYLIHY